MYTGRDPVNLSEFALSRADPTETRSSQLAALLLQVVVVVAVGITGGGRVVQWAEWYIATTL